MKVCLKCPMKQIGRAWTEDIMIINKEKMPSKLNHDTNYSVDNVP